MDYYSKGWNFQVENLFLVGWFSSFLLLLGIGWLLKE